MNKKLKILAVLVNYGSEQLDYLDKVVKGLKRFEKYKVTVVVQSNIELQIEGIDSVNVIQLDDYKLLPLTCRKIIWRNRKDYDIFIYGENDHLFTETHVDSHIKYSAILPVNRISGLLQYEENDGVKYYPGYHGGFEWDFNSVEVYKDKKFAHFSNLHQATFILNRDQLNKIGRKIDFEALVPDKSGFLRYRLFRKIKRTMGLRVKRRIWYDVMCKVNTDIYEFAGMRKMICISDFEDNLIHHLPNLYIDGLKGRNKFRSDQTRMTKALSKLLDNKTQ
jgi:hypothetical protein